MKRAFAEAEKALELGETPVGAVIVKDGMIIGRGGNRVETLKDPTAHAEIIAIGAATETTGYERLVNTSSRILSVKADPKMREDLGKAISFTGMRITRDSTMSHTAGRPTKAKTMMAIIKTANRKLVPQRT